MNNSQRIGSLVALPGTKARVVLDPTKVSVRIKVPAQSMIRTGYFTGSNGSKTRKLAEHLGPVKAMGEDQYNWASFDTARLRRHELKRALEILQADVAALTVDPGVHATVPKYARIRLEQAREHAKNGYRIHWSFHNSAIAQELRDYILGSIRPEECEAMDAAARRLDSSELIVLHDDFA